VEIQGVIPKCGVQFLDLPILLYLWVVVEACR
jgi:hypothetical protein